MLQPISIIFYFKLPRFVHNTLPRSVNNNELSIKSLIKKEKFKKNGHTIYDPYQIFKKIFILRHHGLKSFWTKVGDFPPMPLLLGLKERLEQKDWFTLFTFSNERATRAIRAGSSLQKERKERNCSFTKSERAIRSFLSKTSDSHTKKQRANSQPCRESDPICWGLQGVTEINVTDKKTGVNIFCDTLPFKALLLSWSWQSSDSQLCLGKYLQCTT